jgi:hypothetical protein
LSETAAQAYGKIRSELESKGEVIETTIFGLPRMPSQPD